MADDGGCYEIHVRGQIDAQWSDWFAGLAITHPGDGTTRLAGQVPDQAALHGLLTLIHNLGLLLLSVQRDEPDAACLTGLHPSARPPSGSNSGGKEQAE